MDAFFQTQEQKGKEYEKMKNFIKMKRQKNMTGRKAKVKNGRGYGWHGERAPAIINFIIRCISFASARLRGFVLAS